MSRPRNDDRKEGKEGKKFSITVAPAVYAMLQVLAERGHPAVTVAQVAAHYVANGVENWFRDPDYRKACEERMKAGDETESPA